MKLIHRVVLVATIVLASAASAVALPRNNTIPAKAAIVMDSAGTIVYSKYPNAKLAAASTVKLVTAMVVLDVMRPDQRVIISRNAAMTRSIQPRLHPGEDFSVSDLLHFALMRSINGAAVALAEAAAGTEQDFVVLMNRKAREIGANTSLFANASGLPKGGRQYTTVSDLALILKAALTYPLIKEILGKKGYLVTSAGGREIFLDNSNELLWMSDNVIGGKTGYTGTARHCFVCAVNTDKGPLYTVVLGARSRSSLWRSTLMLTEIGMNPDLAAIFERPRVRRVTIQPHTEKKIQ